MSTFERTLYKRHNDYSYYFNDRIETLIAKTDQIKKDCDSEWKLYHENVGEILTQISQRKQIKKKLRQTRRINRMRQTTAKNLKKRIIRQSMRGTRAKKSTMKAGKGKVPVEPAHLPSPSQRAESSPPEHTESSPPERRESSPPEPTESPRPCTSQEVPNVDPSHTSSPIVQQPPSAPTAESPVLSTRKAVHSATRGRKKAIIRNNTDTSYRPELALPALRYEEYTWCRSDQIKHKLRTTDIIAQNMQEAINKVDKERIEKSYAIVPMDSKIEMNLERNENIAFVCIACEEKYRTKFERKTELIKHIGNIHAYPNHYQCLKCNRSFTQRPHCRKHLEKAHFPKK